MADTQILIVDDHTVVLHGLIGLIEAQEDLKVCGSAETASEALQLLEEVKPDLIISDMSLPDRNGLELIKEVRSIYPDVPVLIMSMHDELLYAERVLKAGGRGYLMKEDSKNVVEAIRKVMKGEVYASPALTRHFLDSFANGGAPQYSFPLKRLSDRELEVFELIGRGHATEEIAEQLKISSRTVDAHRSHIREKLGLSDSNAVLRYAVRWFEGEMP